MIILSRKITGISQKQITPKLILHLTAEERQKVKQKIKTTTSNSSSPNKIIKLDLTRGSVLQSGDILTNEEQDILVEIQAALESVITVTSKDDVALLKAAYHLGNRHVSLEIGHHYLRLSPDHVLEKMLTQMGLQVIPEMAPFAPESGAYKHLH